MPDRRKSLITKVKIGGGASTFLHAGEFEDGRLGEIFIDMSKVGTFQQGMLNAFAVVFSMALQYGAPLNELIEGLKYSAFEPSGFVQYDEEITQAASVVDWVVKRLEKDYVSGRATASATSEAVLHGEEERPAS